MVLMMVMIMILMIVMTVIVTMVTLVTMNNQQWQKISISGHLLSLCRNGPNDVIFHSRDHSKDQA